MHTSRTNAPATRTIVERARRVPSCLAEPLEPRRLMALVADDPSLPFRLYYPEGFAGSTISEFLPILNATGFDAAYRVIARFETGERDQVIAEGAIVRGSRGGITISRAADHSADLVEQGRPYALEIQSNQRLSANLSHYDFGSATGESFTDTPGTTWTFAEAERGDGVHDFVVWQNTSNIDASVQVTFYTSSGPVNFPHTIVTEAKRRGGLSLADLTFLPSEIMAVRVVADQPIVAAVSRYDTRTGTAGATTELGIPGEGSTEGVLPLSGLNVGTTQTITFLNTSTGPANTETSELTLTITPNDQAFSQVVRYFEIPPQSLTRFDLTSVHDLLGAGRFSIRYTATKPVAVRSAHREHGDWDGSPAAIVGATNWLFADGFMVPGRAGADLFETISMTALPTVVVGTTSTVTVTYRFTDGFALSQQYSITGGSTVTIENHQFAPLLEQGTLHQRYFYGIEVSATQPVVAMMWHNDLTLGGSTPAGGFGTLGLPGGTITQLGTSAT